MKLPGKKRSDLDKKFKKVAETPASFDLFVAIHDFVEYIELQPALAAGLSSKIKLNRELDISTKYNYLKQIYQGLEDANIKTNADLGHTRYSVIRDLARIQNNDVSDSNAFWKKRELFRKLTGEVYRRFD